jgi:uncharacterized protein YdhG (YjbR/CyaY superfamily)
MKQVKNIPEYIELYPRDTQKKLKLFRSIVKKLVPKVEESIAYGMPTFKVNSKNLVHFAAYEKHIGFYPTPSGVLEFKKELSKYKTSKGAIQFRVKEDLPIKLIEKIIKFRVKETLLKK